MHWTRTVLASLVSVSAGASTTLEVPAEGERVRVPTQRLETAGYAAWGPRFYVWEEDSRQGRQWAAELALRAGASIGSAGPGEPSGSHRPAT